MATPVTVAPISNEEVDSKTARALVTDDPDAILKTLGDNVDVLEAPLSPEDDRRILRKIDLWLLPVMLISYLCQYLDKSAMGYTAILGLRTDLNLVGQDYSWASAIFYFGYFAGSYLVAYALVRLPVGRALACSIIVWAAIVMLSALCKNASGLLAARFFLGFVESAIAPGMTMIIGMWYKRSEQPIRHAAWFMGNVLGGLFGSVLAYAMGHINTIAPWKGVFLIFGGVTVAWGVVMYFALPDTPLRARFLSKEDRIKAIERVQDNMTGIKNNHWKRYQVVEALTDPKAWLLALIQFSQNLPNGAVGPFASIVVQGLGFSTFDTLLIQMVGTGFQAFFVVLSMVGATYLPNTRTYWMFLCTTVSLIGCVCVRQVDAEQKWARFIAGYCFILAFSANFPMTMSLITSNTGGFTKKTCVSAMVFVGYCVGNIAGPQVMFAREAPSYPSGFAATIACFAGSAILIMVLRFYFIWENRRRDRRGAATTTIIVEGHQLSTSVLNLIDKTDFELKEFRYIY